jgi:hypothetical protein
VDAPLFCPEEAAQIAEVVRTSEPVAHGMPGHGWTVKKVRRWVEQAWQREASRQVVRCILYQAGLSWKKCQKVLKRAKPEKRAAYMTQFQTLYEQVCRGEIVLVYLDESHFHRDLDLGYTWAPVGPPAWRLSDCPPLSDRINWYGAYDFSRGRCLIWGPEGSPGACNAAHTAHFLTQLVPWLADAALPVVIIWDGAPWHRSQDVQDAAASLGFTLLPLPGYSPDLNPIEGLWKWMRQEVTQHHCHATMRALFDACQAFVDRINADPEQIVARLWPIFELDPDYEKLLVSN